ncbi:hypothetical protein N0V86_009110 [Didymella sp. IMI 355093]|nr:hypothetical protein N0V86_009110 [Didymella sp. IMI 355093]
MHSRTLPPKPSQPPKPIPNSLPFAPQALFFALEAIISHPAPTSSTAQPLHKMLAELEQHGISGFFRLRAYMRYHSGVVRQVRRVQIDKGCGGRERYSAGVRLLLDGVTLRDLGKAYFAVVEEVEEGAARGEQRGVVVMENEGGVGEAAEKAEKAGEFWKKHPNGLPMIGRDGSGNFEKAKWVWNEKLGDFVLEKEKQ